MNAIQVRDAPSPMEIVSRSLSDVISLPDPEAATAMNERMAMWVRIDKLQERSFVERGLIIREFEKRSLWRYLTDPETGSTFPHLTAWLSCDNFLGCRRTNFEAKRTLTMLEDVPPSKLIDVCKGNLNTPIQLSTAVRNQPDILEAARTMPQDEFLEKVEKEQPHQHIEARRVLRFSPGRSWARAIEETISYALEHDIAGSRDEALLRMAETSLNEWRLEEEIRNMPTEGIETTT